MQDMHKDANFIIKSILADNAPESAVKSALAAYNFKGNIHMIAIGKAAWTMASAAHDFLGEMLARGIVVTKYGHSMGPLPKCRIYEAAHPISDQNTINATHECIKLAESLAENDELLFLVSGGGSALFEHPLDGISLEDIQSITGRLLAAGADIVEINTIRKRFSAVKAGRFAQIAAPANIFAVILSDVLGDRLDSIASGPTAQDASTVQDAVKIAEKYGLRLTPLQQKYLSQETPKAINNAKHTIIGSVRTLCQSAASAAAQLGYAPTILTTALSCEAAHAGSFLAAIAADTAARRNSFKPPCAIIAGGETVVTLKGRGMGGRNQEMALAAAKAIAGLENILFFSLGSDGTDGPTDAAGGMVDGHTAAKIKASGIDIDKALANNDSYNALKAAGVLIHTGPTGTNVNDVAVILCR